ncbi:hypothetical protein [Paenibacillus bouchesdurhonensis]|uniref:hypothetical protein n=1 Tax=Paenibacillus bouchesdurhonensis TaxID=1870990 RepID=UPI000DA60A08|nr:hypothetical protein [Paenibacillus bouchesdurhonensis]
MNKWIKIFFLAMLMLWLGGCDNRTMEQENIFYDDARMMDSGDSYSFARKLGNVTEKEANIKFSGFSGLYTVWHLHTTSDVTTKISISGTAKQDKFKIIQVNGGSEIHTLWEGEGDQEIVLSIPEGDSAIKWVGKKTSGKVIMQLEPQQGLEVTPQKGLFEDDEFFE